MSDLVKLLRGEIEDHMLYRGKSIQEEAADRIEALEAALVAINKLDDCGRIRGKHLPSSCMRETFIAYNQAGDIARAALAGEGK